MMWQLHHQFVGHGKLLQLLNIAKDLAHVCNIVLNSQPMLTWICMRCRFVLSALEMSALACTFLRSA